MTECDLCGDETDEPTLTADGHPAGVNHVVCQDCADPDELFEEHEDLDDKIERHIDSQHPTGPEVLCACAYGHPEECDFDHDDDEPELEVTETEVFGRDPEGDR